MGFRGTALHLAGALALFAAILSLPSRPLGAQDELPAGRISGRVIDQSSGVPLGDVGVQVVGTSLGTMTGEDGRYTIAGIPAGTVTLHVRRIGFQPKTVTGISLAAGQRFEQNVTLDAAAVLLTGIEVTSAAERGTVHEALNQQREALGIVSAITAEQISRSPDSDAAAAVQRVSGVTLQDNKFVHVRGLGERYTTTSLNGARMPSPEPEKKVVPLDLFPASLLRTVTTSKTFTPDQPGDFSGAQVDIRTREFPAQRMVSYSMSTGINAGATGRPVLAAPVSAGEWFGFANASRQLPANVRSAGGFLDRSYSRSEINTMINSFRNSWTPVERSGIPNSSFGITVGGNDPVLGRQIGYIGALTYSLGQEIQLDRYRAQIDEGTEAADRPGNEFRGTTARTSVLWGGLFNVSTFVGGGTLVTFNNTFNRSADAEASHDRGWDENIGRDVIFERSTLRYVERSVRSHQVAVGHAVGSRHQIDWALSNSAVSRAEPDRSDLAYASFPDLQTGQQGPFQLYNAGDAGARRTFADLTEEAYEGSLDYRLFVGDVARRNMVKVGVLARATDRDAEVLQYAITGALPVGEASLDAEAIFDGRHTQGDANVFQLVPLGQAGSYGARDRLAAAYLMADWGLLERVRLVGGVRFEDSDVTVTTINFFDQRSPSQRTFTDVLPSLALNIAASDRHNVRLSFSQTLARPEYRELSPILHRDVLFEVAVQGNPELRRTLIRNADIRWEWYPNAGEVMSFALFAKRFVDPIERVETPTSGTRIQSFVNAGGAENYGIELEARKRLGWIAEPLEALTVFANATVMRSRIELGDDPLAQTTNADRAMVGQAPYVANAGLTYASAGGRLSGTALYNVVGKRMYSAGEREGNQVDVFDLPRHSLDLAFRAPLWNAVDLRLDAKNLLDAPYQRRQGAVLRDSYRSGRTFTLGFAWRPLGS
ncbi:MAG TPA: TonB-dependent receptor [Gemmatimonadaceae bacterium]|nr:TonB-dependent receptor [Gemmatimonadaceae bacterium]